jgi:hypothetical protein
MPVLFESNTGRVIAIEDKVAAGAISLARVTGSGGAISYQVHNTIITRLGLSSAGNYQFLHTIGNDVYIYVFGDRMGQITVHGLSFAQQCPGGSGPHGFERLLTWYDQNRVAVRKEPVTVTIGVGTTIQGFVTALTGDVQDPAHRTIQFQLTIAVLPDPL